MDKSFLFLLELYVHRRLNRSVPHQVLLDRPRRTREAQPGTVGVPQIMPTPYRPASTGLIFQRLVRARPLHVAQSTLKNPPKVCNTRQPWLVGLVYVHGFMPNPMDKPSKDPRFLAFASITGFALLMILFMYIHWHHPHTLRAFLAAV